MRIRPFSPAAALAAALGAMLILIALPSYLHAQERRGEEASPETLTVPFDPPLGEALAYIVTLEKKRPNGDSRMELEQELTFERLGEGYLLHLDMRTATIGVMRLDLTDEAVLQEMPAAGRPFVMSVAIELDFAGEPIRLRDWKEMRTLLASLPGLAAEGFEGEQRERALEAGRMVFGPMLSASAEEAPYIIVEGWPHVLGYGGLELEAGELYGTETEMGEGLFVEPVPATVEVSLKRTEKGDLRFLQESEPDPEALLAGVRDLVDRISEVGPAQGRVEDELGEARIEMVDRTEIAFAGVTGIPASARLERSMRVDGEYIRAEVVTIERRAR